MYTHPYLADQLIRGRQEELRRRSRLPYQTSARHQRRSRRRLFARLRPWPLATSSARSAPAQ